MMTLREIRRSDVFAAARDFDDAGRFHVWHRRLGISNPADDIAVAALEIRRGVAIVGASGSGKTSTLAAAALGTDEHSLPHVPLRLSASGELAAKHASDPRFLAGQLVRSIAQINSEVQRLVDEAAASGTASAAAATWRAQLGTEAVHFSREMRQRTEQVSFERTPDEVLDVARDAVRVLREAGVRPVALLEDADGLLRLPGREDSERHDIANAFFADGLRPLLAAIDVPAFLAVQPEYRGLAGFRSLSPFLEDVVDAPRPPDITKDGLELLLRETLRTAGVERDLTSLFSADALAVLLHNRYSLPTIRSVLEVCDRGLRHAISNGQDVIEEPNVAYGLTQD